MTVRADKRASHARRLARQCRDYTGDETQRATLLPRILLWLGYDVSPLRMGMPIQARMPGDREFVPAPQILDDLQAVYQIAPEPFELFGQRIPEDNPSVVLWSARFAMTGDFVHGLQPAATLTAALLMFLQYRRAVAGLPDDTHATTTEG